MLDMIVPNIGSVQTEITMDKIDQVTKTIGGKIKKIAQFFGIFLGWCLINLLVAMFVSRTQSVSMETYRVVVESLRQANTQDLSIILAFIFENKFSYTLSLAILLVFSVQFFLTFLNQGADASSRNVTVDYGKSSQTVCDKPVFVVAYKQHVAFLA